MTAPTFRVIAIELYERPVALRIPFRFGAATVYILYERLASP